MHQIATGSPEVTTENILEGRVRSRTVTGDATRTAQVTAESGPNLTQGGDVVARTIESPPGSVDTGEVEEGGMGVSGVADRQGSSLVGGTDAREGTEEGAGSGAIEEEGGDTRQIVSAAAASDVDGAVSVASSSEGVEGNMETLPVGARVEVEGAGDGEEGLTSVTRERGEEGSTSVTRERDGANGEGSRGGRRSARRVMTDAQLGLHVGRVAKGPSMGRENVLWARRQNMLETARRCVRYA